MRFISILSFFFLTAHQVLAGGSSGYASSSLPVTLGISPASPSQMSSVTLPVTVEDATFTQAPVINLSAKPVTPITNLGWSSLPVLGAGASNTKSLGINPIVSNIGLGISNLGVSEILPEQQQQLSQFQQFPVGQSQQFLQGIVPQQQQFLQGIEPQQQQFQQMPMPMPMPIQQVSPQWSQAQLSQAANIPQGVGYANPAIISEQQGINPAFQQQFPQQQIPTQQFAGQQQIPQQFGQEQIPQQFAQQQIPQQFGQQQFPQQQQQGFPEQPLQQPVLGEVAPSSAPIPAVQPMDNTARTSINYNQLVLQVPSGLRLAQAAATPSQVLGVSEQVVQPSAKSARKLKLKQKISSVAGARVKVNIHPVEKTSTSTSLSQSQPSLGYTVETVDMTQTEPKQKQVQQEIPIQDMEAENVELPIASTTTNQEVPISLVHKEMQI